ncbi:MAG: VWA domain-containing protein [Nitrospirae bacterium]|nr:VWA domain-containing protein [Nitrospirota bacterium]MBF0616608.1 VWA domain-containing protein [Nitrospirota bacterium]
MDVLFLFNCSGAAGNSKQISVLSSSLKQFVHLLDENDRFGIIAMGDTVYTQKDLTEATNSEIVDGVICTSNTGDSYKGIKLAFDTISKNHGHKKTIIFTSFLNSNSTNAEKDAGNTQGRLQMLSKELKASDISLYVVWLNDLTGKTLYEDTSLNTGGVLFQTNIETFNHVFSTLYEVIKSPEILPIKLNKLTIDESINSFTLLAKKDTPSTKILLQQPTGRKLAVQSTHSGMVWLTGNDFDIVKIDNATTGTWDIFFSYSKENKAYIKSTFNLNTNIIGNLIPLAKPFKMRAWFDINDFPVSQEEIGKEAKVNAQISYPDNKTMNVNFGWVKNEHVFVSQFVPTQGGLHIIKITVESKDYLRQRVYAVFAKEYTTTNNDDNMTTIKPKVTVTNIKKRTFLVKVRSKLRAFIEFLAINFVLFVLYYINKKTNGAIKNFFWRKRNDTN